MEGTVGFIARGAVPQNRDTLSRSLRNREELQAALAGIKVPRYSYGYIVMACTVMAFIPRASRS